MKNFHVLHVVGARPNFMKAAPVHAALAAKGVRQTLIHTGQHYDRAMSEIFFDQLGLPRPDFDLGVGSGTHAHQTAEVLLRIEPLLEKTHPDWVLVYGDINSTVAAALTAVKLDLPTAHVEAGLRSRDRRMPEEHNRVVTDHLVDLLFTPSADADENLIQEGIPKERIARVGNVMIDTLVRLLPKARGLVPDALPEDGQPFALVTLHRPSNVDDPKSLESIMGALEAVGRKHPVVFPVHPRTRSRLGKRTPRNVRLIDPLGYLEFLSLQTRARLVVTDSGGIQEEATFLGVPCLTVRENTERPITLTQGTNTLIGRDWKRLEKLSLEIMGGVSKPGSVPKLWDGFAGARIAEVLSKQPVKKAEAR